jgi:Ni2+-binding GTPase involved in maturation of urease and hydrogenase
VALVFVLSVLKGDETGQVAPMFRHTHFLVINRVQINRVQS